MVFFPEFFYLFSRSTKFRFVSTFWYTTRFLLFIVKNSRRLYRINILLIKKNLHPVKGRKQFHIRTTCYIVRAGSNNQMPIHVPFNGGNTVLPYFIRISGKKLRSDLPSKLLTPGSHLIPALCGSSCRCTVSITVFTLLYLLFHYTVMFFYMSRSFAIFSGIHGFFTSPFFFWFSLHEIHPCMPKNDYSIIRENGNYSDSRK